MGSSAFFFLNRLIEITSLLEIGSAEEKAQKALSSAFPCLYTAVKKAVIANPSADRCGNPPDFPGAPKDRGIATAVCALPRNDMHCL